MCCNLRAQETSVADLWMECVYNNYPNKGAGVKALIATYQQELINLKLLTDTSSASYKTLTSRFKNTAYILESRPSPFLEQIEALDPQVNNNAINSCHDELRGLTGFNSMVGLFEDKMDSLATDNNLNFTSYFKVLDANFKAQDFNSDFLKMMVFIGLNLDEVVAPEPENEFSLLIEVKQNNVLYVNQQEVTLGVLQDEVFEYVEEVPLYGAAFQINYLESTNQEVLNQVESLVKLVIDQARENYAQSYYLAKFNELDTKTQEDITLKYPQVIKLKLRE